MKKKIIIGTLVVAELVVAGGIWGYSKLNSKYNTLRMSSPQTESSLPANASISQKLSTVENPNKVTNNTATVNDKDKSTLEQSLKAKYEKAHAEEEHVVGWIYIPGTNVDYPVDFNRPGGADFYLTHNWKDQPYWNGAISIDTRCTGFNEWTLINGHNMLNGIMFAQLLKYENLSHARQYQYIYLYEGDGINKLVTYRLVGATYVPNTVPFTVGGLDQQQRTEQINRLLNVDKIYQINQYNGGNVLMLNTCLSNGTNNHILLLSEEVNN